MKMPHEYETIVAPLKSPCVVISQPMYFPWVGMLEQVRLSDTFVHYDDVQYSRGSFSNRVQIKTASGTKWLTVPLMKQRLGQLINEVQIDDRRDWRQSHRDQLRQAYASAPYAEDMLRLVDEVFAADCRHLAELSQKSTTAIIDYFDLAEDKSVCLSSALNIPGTSTQRVADICRHFDAGSYLSGHGARRYLDHGMFEDLGIEVSYMNYGLLSRPQSHGPFTPYVTALDLVAHCGKAGNIHIAGSPIPWREFMNQAA